MAKKPQEAVTPEVPAANVNTTEMFVPETMKIEVEPRDHTPVGDDGEKKELFDPNKAIMDTIYAKRRAQLEKEDAINSGFVDAEPAIDEIPAEPTPVKEAKPPSAVASSPTEPAAAAGTQINQQANIRIKVEGRDLDVPMDTLVTLAQKGLSSEHRYQEAAELRAQAQRLMTSQEAQPQSPAPNTVSQSILSSEKMADIVKRINYGSEEEQAKALMEYGVAIESKVRDEIKPLPTEQIVSAATQNAVTQIRFEQDQMTISNEFPEIFKDKGLAMIAGQIAGEKVQYAQQTGQFRPIIEIWRESLKETQSRYLVPQASREVVADPKTNTVHAATMDSKIERKRAAPQPPSSASKVSAEPIPQYGANPSSIVEKMRKARGQVVYSN